MKINDKIKCDGNIGRIVAIMDMGDDTWYLICFDQNCTEMHKANDQHTFWEHQSECEPYPAKLLMKLNYSGAARLVPRATRESVVPNTLFNNLYPTLLKKSIIKFNVWYHIV